MITTTYKGHEIRIGEARLERIGCRNRWFRSIFIDNKFVTENQHKTQREALFYAQRIIEAW